MSSRLKQLELHGYKTFANRTPFEFAETITAIVGPNGSGKSNIADSIRWVLGEQSYSLLRGKKTEDMIFSGSENRPRAGMATASITFDNSDGWLPIDFSEVSIARRAYRDGQNEYLINGQRVRLKDVSELLAQSGLAERTYTVIGQGLVDAALSLKAGERRRLFEEAAGIGLYRGRREEALRRLDTTMRNLERVQDILAELRPRLRSLERQSRRAREYEQVHDDLQVLLHEYYGFHWNRSQKELAKAKEHAQIQEAALDEVRQDQSKIDLELSDVREHIQTVRSELNNWHRQLSGLHTQRETLSRNLAVGEERSRALVEAWQNTKIQLTNRQEEIELYQSGLNSDEQEIERLNLELDEAREQADKARDALKTRQEERDEAQKLVDHLQQNITDLNTREGQLQAYLSENRARTDRNLELLQKTNQELFQAKEEHQNAQANYQNAQRQEQESRQASEEISKAQNAAQEEYDRNEERHTKLLAESAKLDANIARLNAQLEVLNQAEASLTGYSSGTRHLLQTAKKKQMSGLRGALSNSLIVPAELELAITAALGDFLDAVVVENEPEIAIEILSGDSVRGVLLPLRNIRSSATDKPVFKTNDSEVLGIASQLIEVPSDLTPAVDVLLNQVLVVRDRASARRVLPNQPNGVRVVTLNGEVFYASGPIQTSGTNDGTSDKSILSRDRQRRQLKADISQLMLQNEQLGQEHDMLAAKLGQLREQVGDLIQREKKSQLELTNATSALNSARVKLDTTNRQVQWQLEQASRIEIEIKRAEEQVTRLNSEKEGITGQFDEIRTRLSQAKKSLAELILDELQSQVSHWTTLSAVSERAVADAQARRDERKSTLDRLMQTLGELDERLDTINREREGLKTGQADWHQEVSKVGEQIRHFHELIDPHEATLKEFEAQQIKLQELESTIRNKLSQAEHYHAQARIAHARQQESLETWRRRIEDDLGLVAFEYDGHVTGPTPLPFDGLVDQLPLVEKLTPELEEDIRRQRAQLKRIGPINPEAQEEYKEVKQRFEFLTEQVDDLRAAEADVRAVIKELDHLMQTEFQKTFTAVANEFRGIFTRLFGGGSARLILTDPDDMSETGIDIEARLPGRRTQGLSLLSGGERSLTAAALVFSLLKVSPTPFCVLDEVDAMLDEVNVGRFRDLLRELSEQTQFVIVTHNRNTVQAADVIYGVTMGRDSVSQVISLKLDEVSKIVD